MAQPRMLPPPRKCRARRPLVLTRIPLGVAVMIVLIVVAAFVTTSSRMPILSVQATAVSATAPIFIPKGGSLQTAAATRTAVVAESGVMVNSDDGNRSDSAGTSNSNMIVTMVGYLKDSMVRTVTGCGQLWTNHSKCNEIRQKQKQHRMQIQQEWEKAGLYEDESPQQIQKRLQRQVQGGISFADYMFLQRGKEDRSKVMNMAFLMWGAPKFLPYALMFNPELLPSPFQVDKNAARDWSREQSQAIVTTLVTMEQQMSAATGGYLSSMNIFGKKGQRSKKQVLERVVAETESFLGQQPLPSPSQLLEKMAPYVYKTDTVDYSRAEQRLCQVPPCIVQGLSRAISGQGGLPGVVQQLTPAFMHRSKLVGHLQKVATADDFLVQAEIDLTTISKRLLQEVCRERLLPSSSSLGADELRTALAGWLQQAVHEPTATLARLQGELPSASTTDDNSANTKAKLPVQAFHNGNLARMALLAYNGCVSCRSNSAASRMPRLLYTGTGDIDSVDGKTSRVTSSKHKASNASSSTSSDSSVEGSGKTAASTSAKRSRKPFRK